MSESTRDDPPPTPGQAESAREIPWFRRMPTGGTAYPRPGVSPPAVSPGVVEGWFRRAPNGGTAYATPTFTPPLAEVPVRSAPYARLLVPPERPTGGGTVHERPAGGESGNAGDPGGG